jgi:hypothetical protein
MSFDGIPHEHIVILQNIHRCCSHRGEFIDQIREDTLRTNRQAHDSHWSIANNAYCMRSFVRTKNDRRVGRSVGRFFSFPFSMPISFLLLLLLLLLFYLPCSYSSSTHTSNLGKNNEYIPVCLFHEHNQPTTNRLMCIHHFPFCRFLLFFFLLHSPSD